MSNEQRRENERFRKPEIKDVVSSFRKQSQQYQRQCDHRNSSGPIVEAFNPARTGCEYDKELFTKLFNDQSLLGKEACVIGECAECNQVMISNAMDLYELRKAIFVLKSAMNQCKTLGDTTPNSQDYQSLVNMIEFLDNIDDTFVDYYGAVTNKLRKNKTDNNNNKFKPRLRAKGRQFVSSESFNR